MHAKRTESRSRNLRRIGLAASVWIAIGLLLAACGGSSTSELASQVKDDIQRTLLEDPETRDLRVLNIEMVRETNRVYRGFVDLGRLGDPERERMKLRVTTDGDAFLWESEP